ncbi:MAG: FUSC family protein, partial [Microcystaceae cyanobacterium]
MDYKYALKVAVGGAFIAALFRDSDLANVMFPALGLLSTLQPDLASTIKSGWGRLLGSAIGGLIGGLILTAFGSGSLTDFLSLSPFLGALGFSLAAITCETLQLGSAYTQAGFVAFLLTTGQAATADPWLYTYVRVSTNWIGVAIAVAIIFVFRD